MTMNDIKVGDRFIEWRLGHDINCTDELPEHLHKFYEVYTVEKVNKITFVANGEKYKEVSKYWMHNETNEKLEKLACVKAAKYFVDIIEFPHRSHYYKRHYINMLAGVSGSNLNIFKMAYERAIGLYKERLLSQVDKNAADKLKEALGGK